MATTASFKQQCPSCEAMVPVRDAGLIGRKIDCPKCKYRFVVEDPGGGAGTGGDEDDAPKAKKKADDKAAKKAKTKPDAAAGGEEGDKSKKKKLGLSSTVLTGGAIG